MLLRGESDRGRMNANLQQHGTLPKLSGLARRLVADGLIAEDKARQASHDAIQKRSPLVNHLVESHLVSARDIATAASNEFGLPMLDIKAFDLGQCKAGEFDEKLIRKHHVLPLFIRGPKLFLAVSDPTNIPALDEFKFASGKITEAVLVEDDKLQVAIEEALAANDTSLDGLEDADLDNVEFDEGSADEGAGTKESSADDAPIVRFVHKMLLDAINKGASDIHFEPYEKKYRVRYRIDGALMQIATPPVTSGSRIAARLKVMARLDLAERRVPQDGRIKLKLSATKSIDFRGSTCPTLWGEKVVLRILDPAAARLGIDALGYEENQKKLYMEALAKPYGMILVTGPTGSGKSVSLYTGLNILNTPERNISTAEDPVEINVEGINQVNVHAKVGLTFAAALRSFLRQDPDVIMVGEIRDLETAEIAIKAAQTGHLVLSTLHTNDAPQTLTRLMNMGVPAYNIASSVSLIIAQRLARKLCEHCKQKTDIPREELLKEGFAETELEGLTVFEAAGCDRCNHGYKGRVGIYQVMQVTESIGSIIMRGGNAEDIEKQAAAEGVGDLRRAALNKVKLGIIGMAEANRVTVD